NNLLDILSNFKYSYKMLKNKYFGLFGLRMVPDLVFILDTSNTILINNIIKESYLFNIPIVKLNTHLSDNRFILYPLFSNGSLKMNKFYYLFLIKIFKLSLLKRIFYYNI